MLPQRSASSRYLRSARAAYVARLVAVGAIVAVPAACGGGGGDENVFGTTDATDASAELAPATTNGSTATAAPTTAPTGDTAGSTAAPVESTGATFPPDGEMVVDFTYAPSDSGGRVRNPYVAVWVEDSAGNYVSTIAVWYEQTDKGMRYLNDLRAWITASNGEVTTASTGATRSPGAYSVVWDGTDLDGNKIAQGDYVLYVEAAREHGPYEITSTPVTIGSDGFSVTLPDNGELSGLTATLTA